jgi:hypothetical protein
VAIDEASFIQSVQHIPVEALSCAVSVMECQVEKGTSNGPIAGAPPMPRHRGAYLTQAVGEDDPDGNGLLFNVAIGKLSHLEIIRPNVAMLNKSAKGWLAGDIEEESALRRSLAAGGNDSTRQRCFMAARR